LEIVYRSALLVAQWCARKICCQYWQWQCYRSSRIYVSRGSM